MKISADEIASVIQQEIANFESEIDVSEVGTVLEVGEIKREISYLGDVLNTAARIQGLCNQHGEHLLISESVYERLASVPVGMEIDTIGNSELRGREKAVKIYRVQQRSSAGTSS